MHLNRVFLAGNLTRDPVIRFLANEKAVGEFGLAVNRKFKDSEGNTKEEVTFVDIEVWGRTAELAGQFLTKSKPVFVEGRLKLDSWDDKETGKKRSKLRVVADTLQFIGAAPARETNGGPSVRDETQPPETAAPRTPRPAAPAAAGGTPGEDAPPF